MITDSPDEIISCLGDLRLMPNQHPVPREDLLQLFLEEFLRNEETLWQCLCALRKGVGRFVEGTGGRRLRL